LLAFAIVWQAIGLALALTINLPFAIIYLAMFGLSVAYSHPRVRWKGHPLKALATIALGQGILPFLAGWAAARGEVQSAANEQALVGALAATMLIVGIYPLTQIYQVEEDARRGDFTVARALGVSGSFRFASICILLGGMGAVDVAATRFSGIEAMALLALIALLLIWLWRWEARFKRQTVLENFGTVMRIFAATTLPFLAWIAFHLFTGG
jgi:1,4-dihydroxy-2-naphthoate octaprenyltransferase